MTAMGHKWPFKPSLAERQLSGVKRTVLDSGGNIEFVVADTLSHFKPCDYVPYLQEAAVWLQDEVWE